MSRLHEKSKLIQVLSETPLVSLACKKIGVSRATFYRWYKDDKGFRDSVIQILDIGRKNINDLAEQSLIKELAKGNMNAIRFWLQHNDRRYVPVRTTYIEPVVHHHELKPGETCYVCGHHEVDYRGTVIVRDSSYGVSEGTKKMNRKQLIKAVLEKQLHGVGKTDEEELDRLFGRKFKDEDVTEVPEEKAVEEKSNPISAYEP
jgi:hypothetical protein